jgi:hypothetical protein
MGVEVGVMGGNKLGWNLKCRQSPTNSANTNTIEHNTNFLLIILVS